MSAELWKEAVYSNRQSIQDMRRFLWTTATAEEAGHVPALLDLADHAVDLADELVRDEAEDRQAQETAAARLLRQYRRTPGERKKA